jgi:hypothetical protein
MSKQFRPRSVAAMRRSIIRRYWLLAAFAAGALLMQGCASIPPQPFDGAEASDPDIRVPPAGYRSVLGNYSSQRPVEPSPWRERNDRVAPTEKKDGQ